MSDLMVLNEDNFDETTGTGVAVVDFYADWCGPCKMFAPVFLEAKNEYEGRVSFAKVNVDDSRGLAAKYNVLGIPTIIFFKDGETVDRVSGVLDKETLYAKINAIL
jgi:thioredoxin 1